MNKMQPVLFFALEDEVDPRFRKDKQEIVVTGMGKLNAALSLCKYLEKIPYHVKDSLVIINLGTAGSRSLSVGSLVEMTTFYEKGITFRSQIIQIPQRTSLSQGVCGSGDIVEPLLETHPWNCADMEAFALAKICQDKNIPFVCVKYITDVSEGNVYKDWKKNLIFACEKLYQFWNDDLKTKSF